MYYIHLCLHNCSGESHTIISRGRKLKVFCVADPDDTDDGDDDDDDEDNDNDDDDNVTDAYPVATP